MHHQVVALEKQHQPLPLDGFDFPHTLTAYQTTSTREELHARIRNATVVISTTVKLDAKALHPDVTPHLQYIAASATGTDHVDLAAAKARGIRVTNCPGANLDAVSEHALSLYFAARRRTVLLDHKTREQPSEWKTAGSINKYMRLPDGVPPLTCKEEVLGVIGYGGLGQWGLLWRSQTLADTNILCREANRPARTSIGDEGPHCGTENTRDTLTTRYPATDECRE
jgi:lactate dehydrogenase-like 2-hydroxyacid dehydrogenase